MTLAFQITVHPVLQLGKYTGKHTILFTHSVLGAGRALEDIHTAQLRDETLRRLIAGGVDAVQLSTEIAYDLCRNIDIPYDATVEDIASVAEELRQRSLDAVQVYRKAVTGYPI